MIYLYSEHITVPTSYSSTTVLQYAIVYLYCTVYQVLRVHYYTTIHATVVRRTETGTEYHVLCMLRSTTFASRLPTSRLPTSQISPWSQIPRVDLFFICLHISVFATFAGVVNKLRSFAKFEKVFSNWLHCALRS